MSHRLQTRRRAVRFAGAVLALLVVAVSGAIAEHLAGETSLDDIRIVLWDDELFPVFQKELRRASLGD